MNQHPFTVNIGWTPNIKEFVEYINSSKKMRNKFTTYLSKCFPTAPPLFEMMENGSKREGEKISSVIAIDNTKSSFDIVGFLQVIWNDKTKECSLVNICQVRKPQFHGLVLLMIQTAIRLIKSEIRPEAEYVTVEVNMTKTKLQLFYESCGWTFSSYIPERNTIVYEWELQQTQQDDDIIFQ